MNKIIFTLILIVEKGQVSLFEENKKPFQEWKTLRVEKKMQVMETRPKRHLTHVSSLRARIKYLFLEAQ